MNGRWRSTKVSNIHQLCDVIMEEWKWTPMAICEALVNSIPKRVKAVLETMVATQNIDTLGPIWTFALRGVLTFVASGLDMNGCVLSYLREQQNCTVIQAVHSLLYIVAKCNFFSVVT